MQGLDPLIRRLESLVERAERLFICAHWLHVFGEDFAGRQK